MKARRAQSFVFLCVFGLPRCKTLCFYVFSGFLKLKASCCYVFSELAGLRKSVERPGVARHGQAWPDLSTETWIDGSIHRNVDRLIYPPIDLSTETWID